MASEEDLFIIVRSFPLALSHSKCGKEIQKTLFLCGRKLMAFSFVS